MNTWMNISGRFPNFSALVSGLGTVNRFLFNILRTTRIPSLQEAKVPHPEQSEGPLVVQKKREAVQVQELRLRSLSCVDWTFLWELTAYIAYITRGQGYLLRCHVLRQGYTTWYFKPLHQNPVSLSIGGPEQFYLYSESGLFCAQTIRASGSRMMGWALKWKHAAQHWRLHKQLYQESLL